MKPFAIGRHVVPSLGGLAHLESYVDEPWMAIRDLANLIDVMSSESGSYVHNSAVIHSTARIERSFIGRGVQVHEGVVIRDSMVLDGATVGHAGEVARSLLLPRAMVPRFNYLGSTLVGENVQLGGSVMCASHRHDWGAVSVRWGDQSIDTGMTRLGSIIGDGATIAYGNHLNPGTVVGMQTTIYPGNDLNGYYPPRTLVRRRDRLVFIRRRDVSNFNPGDEVAGFTKDGANE